MSRSPPTVGGDIKDRALLAKGDPAHLRGQLAEKGISIPAPEPDGRVFLMVNETLLRRPPEELSRAFVTALV